ncbi:hypothetical protein HER32_15600 [Hymenobacter sp. BT18]|uniref:hypothetical protein n=1 Tax=Hymenobacter sp. BT18 TaxID=2835648 RepID=UPI00143EE129|nr:hypothetical protein [Hymenobacter sp. BT18]QIX62525.1 hypothetical protein HER32_15600 [Hymenobacter sp. BT18]
MYYRDIFLVPLYLLIFYAIAFAVRPHYTNAYTKKYFIPALTVKFAGALALGLIYRFYYGGGDTFNYYNHASVMYEAFTNSFSAGLKLLFSHGEYDPETSAYAARLYWYKGAEAEFFLVKIASVASLFAFNTYAVMALMFAVFSFSGAWAMYMAFMHISPLLYKRLAYACLFIPSVFFWGSGLMKDTICIGALGWLFYAFYTGTIQKRHILRSVIIGFLAAYLVYSLKVYILLSFLPPALIWIFVENSNRIRNKTLRVLLRPLFLAFGAGAAYIGATNLTAGDSEYDVSKIGERTKITQEYLFRRTKEKGSAYNIGTFDGSMSSIVQVAPQAVAVSLFRPFLWEAKSPIMLLSALEASVFLYMTLTLFWRTGLVRSFKLIAATPILTFCFIFAIVLAVGVGTNSGNFGTLVRYKIPLMPFYMAALYIMTEKATSLRKNKTKPVVRRPKPIFAAHSA